MSINQPYDPSYNAKLHIPKLTEEERRARAMPLENLLSLRPRLAASAALLKVPAPTEAASEAPVPAPVPDYRPSALEVVSAEFLKIFAPEAKQPHEEAYAGDECLRASGNRRRIGSPALQQGA